MTSSSFVSPLDCLTSFLGISLSRAVSSFGLPVYSSIHSRRITNVPKLAITPSRISEAGGSRRKYPRCAECAAPVAALHDHTGEWWLPAMSLADLKAAQRADPHVGRASTLLEADTRPIREIIRDTTDETRSLLAQWPSVHLQDGVLVSELKVDNPHPHTRFQVVAPHGIRRQIFEALHASPQACHLGGTPTTRSHAIFTGLAAHQPSDTGVWSVYPVPGPSLAQARVEPPSIRTLCLPPWSEWPSIYWAPSLRLRMAMNTFWLPVITSLSGCRSGHYLTTGHPP